MANRLEEEAQRLKRKYPPKYHSIIKRNLLRVSEEMAIKQGSVDISEGLIAMSTDLPRLTRVRVGRVYKGNSIKRSGKSLTTVRTRKRQSSKRSYKR